MMERTRKQRALLVGTPRTESTPERRWNREREAEVLPLWAMVLKSSEI